MSTYQEWPVVVWDLGNVLIRWDPHRALAAGVGADEAARFLAAEDFDFTAWNYQQDSGRTWAEAEAAAVASHPHWRQHVLAYRANFDHSLTGAVEDSVDLLRELHAGGVRQLALTNWSAELFPRARAGFDFLALFDDIVVSGEEGTAKPAPEIFEILQRRVGRQLEECVFIDDSPANVAAASAAGLDAILFTDTGHLRQDLRDRGLPVRPATR